MNGSLLLVQLGSLVPICVFEVMLKIDKENTNHTANQTGTTKQHPQFLGSDIQSRRLVFQTVEQGQITLNIVTFLCMHLLIKVTPFTGQLFLGKGPLNTSTTISSGW